MPYARYELCLTCLFFSNVFFLSAFVRYIELTLCNHKWMACLKTTRMIITCLMT